MANESVIQPPVFEFFKNGSKSIIIALIEIAPNIQRENTQTLHYILFFEYVICVKCDCKELNCDWFGQIMNMQINDNLL